MSDDSLIGLFLGLVVATMGLLLFLYWDRVRAWSGHRREVNKQKRNRQGRA